MKHLCDQLFASNSALVKMFLIVSELSFLKLKPDPDIPIILIVFLSLTGWFTPLHFFVRDFPLTCSKWMLWITSIEPRRKGRERGGGRVRMGDRDRLQHLTARPWGVTEGDREAERHIWMQDREKEREGDKKRRSLARCERLDHTQSIQKDSAGINWVQMDDHVLVLVLYTRLQKEKTHAPPLIPGSHPPLTQHNALHLQQGFPLGRTPLQALFLTRLSHFSIRSWPGSLCLHGINMISILVI